MGCKYILAIGRNEGDDVERTINRQLDELRASIERGKHEREAADIRLWCGADVMISPEMTGEIREWLGDQIEMVNFQELPAMRRAVITPHARELSWLFQKLGDIFIDELDHVTRYDFFGGMAQKAINLKAGSDNEPCCEALFEVALEWARAFHNGQPWSFE